MENILLIIVAVFLVFMAFNGYRRGGLRILISMVALVLTLILASLLTPTATKLLKDHTPLYNTINKQMVTFVGAKIDQSAQDKNEEVQGIALEALPLPKSLTNVLIENNNDEAYNTLGVTDFASYTANSLTIILMNAIAYIGLFIIISIIFRVIMFVADIISKLPIINGINRFVGTILGVVQGILILWVLCIALTAFSGTAYGQKIFEMVNDSTFLTFIYNNNLLINIVTSLFKVF